MIISDRSTRSTMNIWCTCSTNARVLRTFTGSLSEPSPNICDQISIRVESSVSAFLWSHNWADVVLDHRSGFMSRMLRNTDYACRAKSNFENIRSRYRKNRSVVIFWCISKPQISLGLILFSIGLENNGGNLVLAQIHSCAIESRFGVSTLSISRKSLCSDFLMHLKASNLAGINSIPNSLGE